jgi:hypothetical protein
VRCFTYRPLSPGSVIRLDWVDDGGNGREPAVNRVDYHETFWFPVTPGQLWAIVERFDLFEVWWGWLRDFRADQGGIVDGNVLHGTVVPPVPYRLRLEDANDGTRVAVAWSLEMRSAPLRVAARVAYPLMRWGHDRVVDMAVSGFRRRALPVTAARETPGSDGGPPPRTP